MPLFRTVELEDLDPEDFSEVFTAPEVISTYAEGKRIGREETKLKLFNLLQSWYDDPAIKRGSPEGEAILAVVRKINRAFNKDEV